MKISYNLCELANSNFIGIHIFLSHGRNDRTHSDSNSHSNSHSLVLK